MLYSQLGLFSAADLPLNSAVYSLLLTLWLDVCEHYRTVFFFFLPYQSRAWLLRIDATYVWRGTARRGRAPSGRPSTSPARLSFSSVTSERIPRPRPRVAALSPSSSSPDAKLRTAQGGKTRRQRSRVKEKPSNKKWGALRGRRRKGPNLRIYKAGVILARPVWSICPS